MNLLELYVVRTTHLGADKASEYYFDDFRKASEYLQNECDNGEIELVRVFGKYSNYTDGCTYNELTCGW
jgi:hypothetical protein